MRNLCANIQLHAENKEYFVLKVTENINNIRNILHFCQTLIVWLISGLTSILQAHSRLPKLHYYVYSKHNYSGTQVKKEKDLAHRTDYNIRIGKDEVTYTDIDRHI